jgi:hypothetical protein
MFSHPFFQQFRRSTLSLRSNHRRSSGLGALARNSSPRAALFASALAAAVALALPGHALAASLTVTSLTLPVATVGASYTTTLTATGGTAPYTWSITSGSKAPAGLTLSAKGVLSGTPTTAAAAATFKVTVKDSETTPKSVTATITLEIVNPLKVTTLTLPIATVGVSYSDTLAATGGVAPYTWSIASGSKAPAGLTLSAKGVLTGKPTTAAAAATFKVTVKDSEKTPKSITATLTLEIVSPLKITSSKLPAGVVNASYSTTLAATGGVGPYHWALASGSKGVPGLTLTAAGVLSGKPTTASGANPTTFAVTVKDSESKPASVTATLSIQINAPLAITGLPLPAALESQTYSYALQATGGVAPYTFSEKGALPKDITLSKTGLLSGSVAAAAASYPFTITVTDSSKPAVSVSASATLQVKDALAAAGNSLPPAYVGVAYTAQLGAIDGKAPYTWAPVASAPLPAGLTLSKTGAISGKPTESNVGGTQTFEAKITDSGSPAQSVVATFTLVVNPPVTSCTNDGKDPGRLYGPYAMSLTTFNVGGAGRTWTIGSFYADGNGHITKGLTDTNGPGLPAEVQGTFTGTYSVGSDGRGSLQMVIPASGKTPAQTYEYCLAIDSTALSGTVDTTEPQPIRVAFHASVIEDDTSNRLTSGNLYRQIVETPNLLTVKGSWTFGLTGNSIDTTPGQTNSHISIAGYVTLDGSGNISTGELDQDIDGYNSSGDYVYQYTPQAPLSGTYTLPATGRGTMTVLQGTESQTTHLVFYPAGQNLFLILSTDAGNPPSGDTNGVTSGQAILQTASSFETSSLSGVSVFSEHSVANSGTPNQTGQFELGLATWNGKGSVTLTGDASSAGVASTVNTTETYKVDSHGRFEILNSQGLCSPCGYLYAPNAGFGVTAAIGAPFTDLAAQSLPPASGKFPLSSLHGTYSLGNRWFSFANELTATGSVLANGAGSLTGTIDQNQYGDTQMNQPFAATATDPAPSKGRIVLTIKDNKYPTALYIVSPSEFETLQLGGSGGESQPVQDGALQ